MTDKALAVQQPVSFEQMKQLAISVAKSGLFGIKDVDQAMALMAVAVAEGRSPALAARDYHIIQGRPALKADTMLSRFQAAGGRVDWKEYTDTKCVGVFSHPQAGSVTVDWTIERATKIGLASKDNWKHYPRAMLRARVISEGVRTCFPGIAVGIYTPEEIEDGVTEIDITPPKTAAELEKATTEAVQHVAQSANALSIEEVEEHVNAMDVLTLPELQRAFEAGWKHASEAKDSAARKRLKEVYELRKADIEASRSSSAGLI